MIEAPLESGRIDITEIHEQAWLPKILRDQVTDGLQIILSVGDIYRPIARRLSGAIKAAGTHRVVDLCSGGGGPWLWLYRFLQRENTSARAALIRRAAHTTMSIELCAGLSSDWSVLTTD